MSLVLSGSILAIEPIDIKSSLVRALALGLSRIHLDIMDGNYVDNISFGTGIIPALKSFGVPVDVHLMVQRTEHFVRECLAFGSDSICIHPQTVAEPEKLLEKIKASGCRAGIAINPSETCAKMQALLPLVDEVLLMTVVPGACGQKFMPERLALISELRANFSGIITLDGGITPELCGSLAEYDIQQVVAGSALFSGDLESNIAAFRRYC